MNIERVTIPIKIGEETLVGAIKGDFPHDSGNCFALVGAGHVCNMYVENFREWQRINKTEKVEIIKISDGRHAMCAVVDLRIPKSWFKSKLCDLCCRSQFRPLIESNWFKNAD